jgi:hypothetical protein
MCGVCGVRYEKTAAEVPRNADDSLMEGEEEEEEVVITRLRQEHITSDTHRYLPPHRNTIVKMK